MATVKFFEELKVWKMSRSLSRVIYLLTHKSEFSKDYKLKDQIRASSGSAMDNIAEGFERNSRKEFIQFLTVAKGSAGETRSQLHRALDQNYITQDEFEPAKAMCLSLARMFYAFIKHLNESEIKGIRYKIEEPLAEYAILPNDS